MRTAALTFYAIMALLEIAATVYLLRIPAPAFKAFAALPILMMVWAAIDVHEILSD